MKQLEVFTRRTMIDLLLAFRFLWRVLPVVPPGLAGRRRIRVTSLQEPRPPHPYSLFKPRTSDYKPPPFYQVQDYKPPPPLVQTPPPPGRTGLHYRALQWRCAVRV